MSLLDIHNVVKLFPVRRGFFGGTREFVHAVNGVDLQVEEAETLGLVGESGCGKTTLGRVAVGLYPPTSGRVCFEGVDLNAAQKGAVRKLRALMQVVFQDPFSSLNPRMSVGDIVTEPILIHQKTARKDRMEKARDLLKTVGLDPSSIDHYPHAFSGGQRQRISIARALSLRP